MELSFTKLSGAGNDFILIDEKLNPQLKVTSELIVKLCDRRYGVGADGLLVIKDSAKADFEMLYFNSDGSSGMLCGNGARCIIRYAYESGRIKNKLTRFIFNNDEYSGKVIKEELIEFNLNSPKNLKRNFNINILQRDLEASFLDTGAHHVVINIDDEKNKIAELDSFPVYEFGKAIRNAPIFNPPGTNVNFISIKNNIINIRTYERGVEEETLACGTGSVASAIIAFLNNNVKPPVSVITKSNEKLIVNFNFAGEMFRDVTLTGPAKIVFNGKYKI